MKKITLIVLSLLVILATESCKTSKECSKKEFSLTNKTDTISYIIGSDVAGNLSANSIDVNPEAFNAGFMAKTNGQDTIFTPEEVQKILADFQQELQQKQQDQMNQESTLNKVKGQNFLEENKKKEGVKVTASGLQYKVIQEGTGRKPLATSTVTVHYEGKLIDGTIFDSSYQRGETISFPLNQVIPGWTEGLQLMSEGSIYELYIPSELGYGDRSIPGIPAGSCLIFKVELFSFQ